MGDKLHLRSARWGPPWIAAALAWCLLFQQLTACGHPAGAQEPETSLALATDRDPAPAGQPSPASQLPPPAAAEGGEELLPINLPAALRLANAQAWDIAIAVRQVRIASAQLQGARVLWLPNLIGGVDYLHHDGPVVSAASGAVTNSSYSSLYAGMAPLAIVGLTDALFAPLAARQVTCAQQANVQTATNDTLTSLAVAYFDVVEARACLACIDDVVRRVEQLVCKTESLAPELVPELEVARARAALASVEEVREAARRGWRVASAEVVRLARLKPAVLIAPLESPQLQLTLVPAECTREGLIATALQNRPELAFQRAQVEAARHRLQQERWRPFLPTLVARGSGTQAPYPMALGAYWRRTGIVAFQLQRPQRFRPGSHLGAAQCGLGEPGADFRAAGRFRPRLPRSRSASRQRDRRGYPGLGRSSIGRPSHRGRRTGIGTSLDLRAKEPGKPGPD